MAKSTSWWQSTCIYQIYPRSFQDSNGDGIGDLDGIKSRLGYLAKLGVGAIWISPIFPSPMKDFGYDVSNYIDIEPMFGTLASFDQLLLEAHRLGLKVLLDFVPNHTSDQHLWFKESRSSLTHPKRDWYIWKDPKTDGTPPNNWLSQFGGPAWTLDPKTNQYYCHSFLSSQPDLNWRNPDVEKAMLDHMRFWFDRGVDGFRIDALHHSLKDDEFRDDPLNPHYHEAMPELRTLKQTYSIDRPEIMDLIKAMRRLADQYDERVLIGEIYLPLPRIVAYYGEKNDGLHLPFNFQLLGYESPWRGDGLASIIDTYEQALPEGGWPNWVLGNHDRPRVASRLGPEQAGVAVMMLLTLRGTPTLYYGDELGMTDVSIPPHLVQDPFEINVPGLGLGRDPVRTPMQWDSSENAGFTTGRPWLPLASDWRVRNVESCAQDSSSLLRLNRDLLALRRREPALFHGSYKTVFANEAVLVYLRQASHEKSYLVALNFSGSRQDISLPSALAGGGLVVISTIHIHSKKTVRSPFVLGPHEGLIIELNDDVLA